eukprot:7408681-Pyramimonas_sp.AAC.1
MATARPMSAPMSIAPACNDDGALASAMKFAGGVRRARAVEPRGRPALSYATPIVPPSACAGSFR